MDSYGTGRGCGEAGAHAGSYSGLMLNTPSLILNNLISRTGLNE